MQKMLLSVEAGEVIKAREYLKALQFLLMVLHTRAQYSLHKQMFALNGKSIHSEF
jgi:hypothetical protein